MQKNLASLLGIASLAFGVLFAVLSIALLGTPVTDVGMVSVTLVFLLFGLFGFLLGRQQEAAQ